MRSVGAWFFQLFVRITGYPFYRFWVNPKYRYEDRKVQGRIIKGKAIIVSNHTTVWDFGFWLYALPLRAHRCIMADILRHMNFFLTSTPEAIASSMTVPNSACVEVFGLTTDTPSIWITNARIAL